MMRSAGSLWFVHINQAVKRKIFISEIQSDALLKGTSLWISEFVKGAALPGLFEPLALFPKGILHLLGHEPDQAGGKLVHKG